MISDKEARQYILQQLYDEGYRYLARDEGVFLYAYKYKPVKKQYIWDDMHSVSSCLLVHNFLCFKDIRWVDEEPLDIAKEVGIIDWTKIPKDTKVLVWDGEDARKEKRYFSHYVASDTHFPFKVYYGGATSWSTTVETVGYQCCELINEVEEQDHHD
jgi:nucleoid-associated protein YejK